MSHVDLSIIMTQPEPAELHHRLFFMRILEHERSHLASHCLEFYASGDLRGLGTAFLCPHVFSEPPGDSCTTRLAKRQGATSGVPYNSRPASNSRRFSDELPAPL